MVSPKIHVSVFERIANSTGCYAPVNLPYRFQVVGTRGARTWPSQNTLERIEKQVTRVEDADESLGRDRSLLDGLSATVKSGKWSYRVFAAVSMYAVVVATLHVAGSGYVMAPIPQITAVISPWCPFSNLAISSIYVCIGLLVWLWSGGVDKRMASLAQSHWQHHRKALRTIITDCSGSRRLVPIDKAIPEERDTISVNPKEQEPISV